MKKFWSYFRLFITSMGLAMILLIFYTAIKMLFDSQQKNIIDYYKSLADRLSIFMYTWNTLILSVIIFILLLIYYKGKSPFGNSLNRFN